MAVEEAYKKGVLHMKRGNAFQSLTAGDPDDNLDRAIQEYELALAAFPRRGASRERASTLANLAICLQDRRRGNAGEDLERAITAYEKCRRIITRKLDAEQWAALTVNLGIAWIERWQGSPAENIETGIRYLQSALRGFTRDQFPYDWATTQSTLGAAWVNRIRGRLEANQEKGIACFHRALEVLDPRQWPYDRATALVNLGASLRARERGNRAENLEQALRAYQESMRLRPREADPMQWASTLLNLSFVHQQRVLGRRADNLERALKVVVEALEILTAAGDPFGRARALVSLSDVLQDRVRGSREDNLERAVAAAEEALEIATGAGHPNLLESALGSLGAAYLARAGGDRSDNLEKAMELLESLLEMRTREGAGLAWARTVTNLAIAYRELTRGDRTENLERAIELLEQALEEQERAGAAADQAVTLIHLAAAYQERLRGGQGENLERSIALGLRAVKLMRRGNSEERALALMLVGISMIHRIHGDPEENVESALFAFQTALEVLRNAPARERARVLANLGTAWSQRRRGDRAENLEAALRETRRALRLLARKDGPAEWAGTMHNLGIVYARRVRGRRRDNVRRALAAFRAALDVFRPDNLPHQCRMTAQQMGALLADEGRWNEAAAAYALAGEAAETLYRTSLLPGGRELELAETGDLAWCHAFALARAGRGEDAAIIVERARARGLSEALARDRADLGRVEAENPEVVAEYREAARALRELELAEQAPAPGTGKAAVPDRGVAALRRQEGRTARARLEKAIQEIRGLPGFTDFLREAGSAEIAAAVPSGGALVYVAATPRGALALCIPAPQHPLRVEPVWAESLTARDLDRLLGMPDGGRVEKGYVQGQLVTTAELGADLQPLLARLGRELVGPVARRLLVLDARSVTLIPGGKLALVPLHAAPFELENREVCLLEEMDVAYAPAARVLSMARVGLEARRAEPPSLGGLADPRPDPRPLRHARAELGRIAALFDPLARRTAVGEEATREAFFQMYGQVTHLHLACHGQFDGWDPMGSCLLLARGEKLELRDLLALEAGPAPRLIALSACQTAIQEFQNLPDQVIGWPSGFLRSGAAGVVASLWPVDDLASALLMMRFYEIHLRDQGKGLPPPIRALRQAQLWLRDVSAQWLLEFFREQRGARERGETVLDAATIAAGLIRFDLTEPESQPFADPYYWAPFLFVGV
ncbi:MAG TPA: CHAT domain-containing protein [Thermoanaerobaculia bacterium]